MITVKNWRRHDLAIDFGTANLRLIRRNEGVVFDEPSLCCFADRATHVELVAAGMAARAMSGRTPGGLQIRHPLRRGVLQDIETATQLLRYAVPKAFSRKQMYKARTVIGVPADATRAERAALRNAATDAGLGAIRLMPEPFAAAIGAGLRVGEARGTMIVECGAGTTEAAVISLGGMCATRSVRIGGHSLDQAIADYLHFEHKFLVGPGRAEQITRAYGEATRNAPSSNGYIEARGRNYITGGPASFQVPCHELDHVVERHVLQIVNMVLDLLHHTPPELSRDIHINGVMLRRKRHSTRTRRADRRKDRTSRDRS